MQNKERLLDIIPNGKGNAIHLEELAFRLGVHPMVAKELIRKARIEGAHILSDTSGYWLSSVTSEMQDYVNRMRKHALSELFVIMPIVNALRESDGQIGIAEYIKDCVKENINEQTES